ncbi:SCO family protein [Sulfurisoma sediminicola]|uniref:Protein SCO1/2 n=1 Tax=Sulfurisoma sediminicola TaxID=1381557 RepID=A0A497XAP8_9PROT|nr:SCO family protein [Sulfurisoma sediminicola]RLJ62706.1 protein SCO1/2 [Sulfurisoma sediminicola]
MSNRMLLVLIGVLAAAIVGLALLWNPAPPTATAPHAALPAATPSGGDFTLQSATGPVSLRDFRGKVVLVYFGYTYCPDICPTSLTATAQALGRLAPAELAQVQTIFISVDPERDTPNRLKEYGAFFHPSIIGITGAPAEIAEVARRYGASYAKQQLAGASNYVVDHSALTYVVAPDGRLVGALPHAAPPEKVVTEIRKWLSTSTQGATQ